MWIVIARLTVGSPSASLIANVSAGLILVGGVVGRWLTPTSFQCADPTCRAFMSGEVPVCPGCGGSIVETIAHAKLRIDRLEQLEADPTGERMEHPAP